MNNFQLMKGTKWGSGDAKTYYYTGEEAVEIKNQSHWQDCVWFRADPDSLWTKASGFCCPSASEKNSYFWTQEKLSALWNSQLNGAEKS